MNRRPAILLPMLVVLLAGSLSLSGAQEEEVFDIFRPTVVLAGEAAGERSFKEDEDPYIEGGEDTLLWRSGSLGVNVPLGGTHLGRPGPLLGYQFFAHASAAASALDLSAAFLDDDLGLYRGGIGLSALMLSRGRRLYAAAVFATAAEEEATRDDPDLRPTAIGLGSFPRGSTLWIYGGAYTYHLGRPLVFPVLGAWSRISPDWTLAGVVPFLFKATYEPAPAWRLGLFMKVTGNRYRFDNGDDPGTAVDEQRLPGEPADLDLRLVQGKIGADLSWRVSDHVSIVAEAGSLVGRRLVFSHGDDEVFSAEVEPGGYASLRLSLGFGETIFDEATP